MRLKQSAWGTCATPRCGNGGEFDAGTSASVTYEVTAGTGHGRVHLMWHPCVTVTSIAGDYGPPTVHGYLR